MSDNDKYYEQKLAEIELMISADPNMKESLIDTAQQVYKELLDMKIATEQLSLKIEKAQTLPGKEYGKNLIMSSAKDFIRTIDEYKNFLDKLEHINTNLNSKDS
jgi:hypothetical protein